MTVIIYKDGQLAADSRESTRLIEHKNCHCIKCGASVEEGVVCDIVEKIQVVPKDKVYMFHNTRVLAYAGSGDTHSIAKLQKVIENGWDIIQAYQHFNALSTSNMKSCRLLLVGEHDNRIVKISEEGLSSVTYLKTQTLQIGSGEWEAKFYRHITEDRLTASEYIHLVKDLDDSVGGNIRFVNIDGTNVSEIKTFDPSSMIVTNSSIQKAIAGIHLPNKPTRRKTKE